MTSTNWREFFEIKAKNEYHFGLSKSVPRYWYVVNKATGRQVSDYFPYEGDAVKSAKMRTRHINKKIEKELFYG